MIDITFANYLKTAYRWCGAADDPFFYTRDDIGFDFLTATERKTLSGEFPPIEKRLFEWAAVVKYLPLTDRKLRIAEKVAVLRGLYPDPEAMVEEAMLHA
jgi:hypothetical protein